MSDALAGMTRDEAVAFVNFMWPQAMTVPQDKADDMARLLALAALGAECVGAKEGRATFGTFVLFDDGNGRTYLSKKERVLVLPESE